MSYGHSISVDLPFDATVQAIRDALAGQGFGVIAPDLGLLLLCNLVVRRAPGAAGTVVAAIDPQVLSQLSPTPAVAEIAADAETRLRAALDDVTATARAAATRSHR